MKKVALSLLFVFYFSSIQSQIELIADEGTNAYAKINSVFAPGYDILEVPDCAHPDFGKHIEQVFDEELDQQVFKFHLHKENDNDACQSIEYQRNEIKTNFNSPDELLGIEKETVTYSWKMKLDVNFLASSNFTHLHQLEAQGGLEDKTPLFTITAINQGSEKIQLRYADAKNQSVLIEKELASFKGKWLQFTETITYGEIGAYELTIQTLDEDVLLNYKDEAIRAWRTDADFIRPKWGIYRSLKNIEDLQNEVVLFADFKIAESDNLSLFRQSIDKGDISIYPNPTSTKANIKGDLTVYDEIVLCNSFGKELKMSNTLMSKSVDVSKLNNGIYFVVFKKDNKISAVKKLLKF